MFVFKTSFAWAWGETFGYHYHGRQPAQNNTSGEYSGWCCQYSHTQWQFIYSQRRPYCLGGLVQMRWQESFLGLAAQFTLLTTLCILVPHPMPFPPVSAHTAPKFTHLRFPSRFYFPFFHLTSLFSPPIFNAMQPGFFPLHTAKCRGKKRPTHLKGRTGIQVRGRAAQLSAQVLRRAGHVSVHSK